MPTAIPTAARQRRSASFSISVVFQVPQGRIAAGNSCRGIVIGPGIQRWDIQLPWESTGLKFRGEMLKAIDHANFNTLRNDLDGVKHVRQGCDGARRACRATWIEIQLLSSLHPHAPRANRSQAENFNNAQRLSQRSGRLLAAAWRVVRKYESAEFMRKASKCVSRNSQEPEWMFSPDGIVSAKWSRLEAS